MVPPVIRRKLTEEVWVRTKIFHLAYVVEKMWNCNMIFFSTSVLSCQQYSAHAPYSSAPNAARTRRTYDQYLETLKKQSPF